MTNAIYSKPSLDVSEETETINHLMQTFNGTELEIQQRLHQMPSDTLLFARGKSFALLFLSFLLTTYAFYILQDPNQQYFVVFGRKPFWHTLYPMSLAGVEIMDNT